MIASVTHDIGAAMERENDVYRHVGKMTSRMAGVEDCLTLILARALAPEDPAPAQLVFRETFFNSKMQYLKLALPAEWVWKKPLLEWVQKVESYRNSLAHSSVHTAFGITEPTARTLLRKKGTIEEVDATRFEEWEAKADILFLVTLLLSRSPTDEFLQADLRALGEQAAGSNTAQIVAVNAMFPAAPKRHDGPSTMPPNI